MSHAVRPGRLVRGLLPRSRPLPASATASTRPCPALHQLATSAEALAGAGRAADAARLLGAYDQHDEVFGAGAAGTRESRAAAERLARTELGEQGYARVYAEGCGLSVEEAAALV